MQDRQNILPDLTEEQLQQIKKPEWLQPDAEPLTKAEIKAARQDAKVLSYPERVTGHVTDPVGGQNNVLISFIFRPNHEVKEGMHGLFRVDSVWPSEEQADKRTDKILETMDSRHIIHQVRAGVWNPITNNPVFSKEEVDLDLKKKVEKEHEDMKDDVFLQEREKFAKESRLAESRREELEKYAQAPQADDTLTEFITKQNLYVNLENYIQEGLKKVEDLRKKQEQTKEVIEKTKEEHPEFLEIVEEEILVKDMAGMNFTKTVKEPKWMFEYNNKRNEVGLSRQTEEEFYGPRISAPLQSVSN